MNVEFFMAARARIVYRGITKLSAALLDRRDDDDIVASLEEVFGLYYGSPSITSLDAIEYKIAELVDHGESLPISNVEAYEAAVWMGQSGLAALPNPMPRAFVLYIAKALEVVGSFGTMTEALNEILTTKTFA